MQMTLILLLLSAHRLLSKCLWFKMSLALCRVRLQLLIGFESGTIVQWDLRAKKADFRIYYDEVSSITCVTPTMFTFKSTDMTGAGQSGQYKCMVHIPILPPRLEKNSSNDCLSGCYGSISNSSHNCTAVRSKFLFVNTSSLYGIFQSTLIEIQFDICSFSREPLLGATGSWVWRWKIPEKEGIKSQKVLHYWNNKACVFLLHTNPLGLFEGFFWLKMSEKLDSIQWCCILGHIYAIKPLLELHVFE